jgi:hypothetical protein
VPHYYNANWQPYYLTRDDLYLRGVNLGVPGAVTVVSVDDFYRGDDWRRARRADRNMLANVNPVLDPLLLTPLRNAAVRSAWGRGKKDLPPGIAKKLQDTTVITSRDIVAPAFRRDLARTMRVERVSDRVKGQKFKVKDERQGRGAPQASNGPPAETFRNDRIDRGNDRNERGNSRNDRGNVAPPPQVVERQGRPVTPKAERVARPEPRVERNARPAPKVERPSRPVQPQAERVSRPVERPRPQQAQPRPQQQQRPQAAPKPRVMRTEAKPSRPQPQPPAMRSQPAARSQPAPRQAQPKQQQQKQQAPAKPKGGGGGKGKKP